MLEYLQKLLFDFKMKELSTIHKERDVFQYKLGDFIYITPLTSQRRTTLKKVSVKYVRPVVVYEIIDPKSLLCTLDGKLLLGLFEHEGLKPAVKETNGSNVTTLPQLKQYFHTGIRFS